MAALLKSSTSERTYRERHQLDYPINVARNIARQINNVSIQEGGIIFYPEFLTRYSRSIHLEPIYIVSFVDNLFIWLIINHFIIVLIFLLRQSASTHFVLASDIELFPRWVWRQNLFNISLFHHHYHYT